MMVFTGELEVVMLMLMMRMMVMMVIKRQIVPGNLFVVINHKLR